MFTGIIGEIGRVEKFSGKYTLKELVIRTAAIYSGLKTGDSVAVNGVCLTLTKKKAENIFFEVMGETLVKTNLKNLGKGDKVNLERSLQAGGFLSGHFVYGHVDGIRQVALTKKSPSESFVDIAVAEGDQKYIVEKGSIAIDGISLTIGKLFSDRVRLFLIPHTLRNTTLRDRRIGDGVNVEFDILAKYIYKQSGKGGITEEFLRQRGFVNK